MSHLEDLLCEYYEWRDYIVRRNIKVGPLSHGGWEGELDIVAYHPQSGELEHLEPSIDALSWTKREERFARKFATGRKYIFRDVFPWLGENTPLRQVAVLITRGKDRSTIGGGEIVTIDEFMRDIRNNVGEQGKLATSAISEQYPLLRTIQLVDWGYYRVLQPDPASNVPKSTPSDPK